MTNKDMMINQHPILTKFSWPNMPHVRSRVRPWLPFLLMGMLTFSLRAIFLHRSFDIFIDEISYLRIGQNVAAGLEVTLYGKPFHLHPPAYFFFEAAYLRLGGITGSTIEQIYAVRYLNVLFATLSGLGLLFIGQRVGGWMAGIAAAVIFAADPFLIKMNSLVLLDTPAMWWVIAGYAILIGALRDAEWSISPRRALAAGICFGLAVLTKDMSAFVTVLPLTLCFGLNGPLRRRTAALVVAVTCLTYGLYPLAVLISGQWQRFADQKLNGLYRLMGAAQETGLNREVGPSLLETVLARLDQFGPTYVVVGLGMLPIGILFWSARPGRQLVSFWAASAYMLLGYCILFGTLEEQFFYILMIPCVLTIAVGSASILTEGVSRWPIHHLVRVTMLIGSIAFVIWSGNAWIKRHMTPDNGYERLLEYIEQYVPHGSRITATSETAQFLLGPSASAPWGQWHTIAELQAGNPDYVIVTPAALRWNHGAAAAPLIDWIGQHGTPVFTFTGQSAHSLHLYRLRADAAHAKELPALDAGSFVQPPP